MTLTKSELSKRFRYHPPRDDQPERYLRIRAKAQEFANLIIESTPSSREQSLAITNLEQAVMWANAGIARNEEPTERENHDTDSSK